MGSGAEAGSFKAGTLTSTTSFTSGIGTTTHAFSNPIVVGGAITAVKQPGGGAAGTGMSNSAFAAAQYGYMPNYGGAQINSTSRATGAAGTGLSTTAFAAKQYGYMPNYGTQTNMASQIIIKSNAPFVPKGAPNVPGQSSSYYYGGAGAGTSADAGAETGTAIRTPGGSDVVANRNSIDSGPGTFSSPTGYAPHVSDLQNSLATYSSQTGNAPYVSNPQGSLATFSIQTGYASPAPSGLGVVVSRNSIDGGPASSPGQTGYAPYVSNPQGSLATFGTPNGYGP
jgi:hypothetical protein